MAYWDVLKRQRFVVGSVMFLITVGAIITSLFLPVYYKAEAVIMPISGGSKGGGLAAVASQLGGLGSLVDVGGGGGSSSRQFMALLKSKSLAEKIIEEYNLAPVFFGEAEVKRMSKNKMLELSVQELLASSVKFLDDRKDNTIRITAEFQNPQLAADIANGYVKGLQEFVSMNSFTVAKRNRVFIENQLQQNKRELLIAGKELNLFYKTPQISNVEAKIDVPTEVGGTTQKLSELEEMKTDVEASLSVKDVPQQVYLQYLTMRRNLLVQINGLLTQQYEMARIEEAKEDLAFQVVDSARVPEKKSRPNRTRVVFSNFIASIFLGIFTAFLFERIQILRAKS